MTRMLDTEEVAAFHQAERLQHLLEVRACLSASERPLCAAELSAETALSALIAASCARGSGQSTCSRWSGQACALRRDAPPAVCQRAAARH